MKSKSEFTTEYREYLKSPEWHQLRVRLLEERGCKCQKCGENKNANQLHIHHKTYKRLFKEKDSDLLILCFKCHMIVHGLIENKEEYIEEFGAQLFTWLKKLDRNDNKYSNPIKNKNKAFKNKNKEKKKNKKRNENIYPIILQRKDEELIGLVSKKLRHLK